MNETCVSGCMSSSSPLAVSQLLRLQSDEWPYNDETHAKWDKWWNEVKEGTCFAGPKSFTGVEDNNYGCYTSAPSARIWHHWTKWHLLGYCETTYNKCRVV